jgi:lipopolysaccharide export system protein LptC
MDSAPEPDTNAASETRKAPRRLPFSVKKSTNVSRGYGRFVGVMRILLPTVATALVILVLLWPHLSDQQRRFSITPAKIDYDKAPNLTMRNSVFTGVDKEKRPYTLTADSVRVVSDASSEVKLTAPKADVLMSDGSWVAVTAEQGVFDREAKLLTLRGSVNLFHDRGYEFKTDYLVVDLAAGMAHGNKPVQGQGPFGNLRASGFVIHNRGERIEFKGPSTLLLYPKRAGSG